MSNSSFIQATSLKGYCSIAQCWQYIYDIATQIGQCKCGKIDLSDTVIDGNRFHLQSSENIDEQSNVWMLAASAIELVNGSPILNGKGEKAQKATTPIPQLPQFEATALNALIKKCLSFDKPLRPSFSEIAKIAHSELEILESQPREHRPSLAASDKKVTNAIDKAWPETMISSIRCIAIIILLSAGFALNSHAKTFLQNHDEPDVQKLVEASMLLKNNDKISWDRAQESLEQDINKITLMDELKDIANDCVVRTKNRFGINVIMNSLKSGNRVQVSDRDFLSGTDPRFNYSIYERGVKAGATSTYTLKGRSGRQCFVVIPYSATQSYNTELSIGHGPTIAPTYKDSDGITYYIIDTAHGPNKNELITFKIHNSGATNASFVVINHNYRDK